jgi:hypothetical protein
LSNIIPRYCTKSVLKLKRNTYIQRTVVFCVVTINIVSKKSSFTDLEVKRDYNCNVYSKQNEVWITTVMFIVENEVKITAVMFIAVFLILHTIAVFLFYNMDTSDAHNEVTLDPRIDRSICIV